MGKLEEAQILWNAIGTETEPDANTTTRVRNAGTKIIDFITDLVNVVSTKVDKVAGKALSTNDYSNAEKSEVAKVADKVDKIAGKGLSTNDFTNEAKAEVAKVADKVDKIAGMSLSTNDYSNKEKAEVAKVINKVNKVSGKRLSTNDYTNEAKAEVAKIADKVNVDLFNSSLEDESAERSSGDTALQDEINVIDGQLGNIKSFINQFLTTETGELILDINNNIIVTL
jgi:predicted metalloendopeptidase